jgi:hypothetical protein
MRPWYLADVIKGAILEKRRTLCWAYFEDRVKWKYLAYRDVYPVSMVLGAWQSDRRRQSQSWRREVVATSVYDKGRRFARQGTEQFGGGGGEVKLSHR